MHVEGRPTDLAAYLLDCVPSSVAPKEFTLRVLHAFGLSKTAGIFTAGFPVCVDLAKQMRH